MIYLTSALFEKKSVILHLVSIWFYSEMFYIQISRRRLSEIIDLQIFVVDIGKNSKALNRFVINDFSANECGRVQILQGQY